MAAAFLWSLLAGVRVKMGGVARSCCSTSPCGMWLRCLPVAVDAVAKGVSEDVPCKLQILPNVDVRPLIIVGWALARVVDSEKTSHFHLVNEHRNRGQHPGWLWSKISVNLPLVQTFRRQPFVAY
jgi:hypothetical protein